MSPKRAERQEKFKNLNQIRLGDPNVNDYTTGRPSHFMICNGASNDPGLRSLPGAPEFKTPQWMRTAKAK